MYISYAFRSDWSVERIIHMQQEIGLIIAHALMLTLREDVMHEVSIRESSNYL